MDTESQQSTGKREEQRLARRDAILEIATSLFLEKGYSATSMSGIVDVMGGSKATLWRHFPSKQVLFTAVVDRATREFRTGLEFILTRPDELKVTLFNFCEAYLERMTSTQAIALKRMIIGEVARFPEIGSIFYERGPKETCHLLARYIGLMMEQGKLRQDDPINAAQQLIGRCTVGVQQPLLMGAIKSVGANITRSEAMAAVTTFLWAFSPPQ